MRRCNGAATERHLRNDLSEPRNLQSKCSRCSIISVGKRKSSAGAGCHSTIRRLFVTGFVWELDFQRQEFGCPSGSPAQEDFPR